MEKLGKYCSPLDAKKKVKSINNICKEKVELIVAGCQLNTLTHEDVDFIINPKTSVIQAENRLIEARHIRW